MTLSTEAQALFDHARNSLPRWLTGAPSTVLEWLYGFTEIFDEVRSTGQGWIDLTYILNATGAELDQHAADRGTSRRSGESDDSLRYRIRQIDDAVTEPALQIGVDAILAAIGTDVTLNVAAYTTTGWNTRFYADHLDERISIDSTLTLVNNGTNPLTAVIDDDTGNVIVSYTAGVSTYLELETTVLFNFGGALGIAQAASSPANTLAAGDAQVYPYSLSGIVALRRDRAHMHTIGTSTSFLSRGYRMTGIGRPMAYIFILPYGTTEATANAVSEYLRQNGPAGYLYYVERRLIL